MNSAQSQSSQAKSAGAREMMSMGYEDEMNSDNVDYQQKYHAILHDIEELVESKTRLTQNTVFYDLIQVSELRQILNKSQENLP